MFNIRTCRDDLANELVAQHSPIFKTRGESVEWEEVGTTNCTLAYSNDGISRIHDFWIRDGLNLYLTGFHQDYGSHEWLHLQQSNSRIAVAAERPL